VGDLLVDREGVVRAEGRVGAGGFSLLVATISNLRSLEIEPFLRCYLESSNLRFWVVPCVVVNVVFGDDAVNDGFNVDLDTVVEDGFESVVDDGIDSSIYYRLDSIDFIMSIDLLDLRLFLR
jgi:hypothetical protein